MPRKLLKSIVVSASAAIPAAGALVHGVPRPGHTGERVASIFSAQAPFVGRLGAAELGPAESVTARAQYAARVFSNVVRPLSHPQALETAFRGYFALKASRPDEVRKPFLYFVDYGLPSSEPRGYVFEMDSLRIVEGPFMVAHGRGSGNARGGVPKRFSNRPGSLASSLGAYIARETYPFLGKAAGRAYRSIGLRLDGVSGGFNDKARERRVVAHGAPYVTATSAGRSEGCPAMEPQRAARLLPKLADGGVVFVFAPQEKWMHADPWIVASE